MYKSPNISLKYIIPPILLAYRHEAMSEVWVLFNNLYHLVGIGLPSVGKCQGYATGAHVVGRLQAPKVCTFNISIYKEVRFGTQLKYMLAFSKAIALYRKSASLLVAVKAAEDNIGMMPRARAVGSEIYY